jgi:flagellar basal body-associated protein FliL
MKKLSLTLVFALVLGLVLAACNMEPKEYPFPLPKLTVNIKATEDAKYKLVLTTIELVVLDTLKVEDLTEKQGAVQDTINKILRAKTEPELLAEDILDTLDAEITAALNALLESEYIVRVNFLDYMLA